jgi:hypothetical protein
MAEGVWAAASRACGDEAELQVVCGCFLVPALFWKQTRCYSADSKAMDSTFNFLCQFSQAGLNDRHVLRKDRAAVPQWWSIPQEFDTC